MKGYGYIMKKVVYDGMRYPSIDDLLNVIDSKYKLAICAAKRAKIIEEENWTSAENAICCKAVVQALEEILEGKTMMTFKKN